MSNVTPMTKPQLTKFAELVAKMRDEMPVQIEYIGMMAKIRREQFKAYKAEGFTDAQALELVKAAVS